MNRVLNDRYIDRILDLMDEYGDLVSEDVYDYVEDCRERVVLPNVKRIKELQYGKDETQKGH